MKLQQCVFGLVGVDHHVPSVPSRREYERPVEVPLQRAFPFLLRFTQRLLVLLSVIQHRAVAAVTRANGDDYVVEEFVRLLHQRRRRRRDGAGNAAPYRFPFVFVVSCVAEELDSPMVN